MEKIAIQAIELVRIVNSHAELLAAAKALLLFFETPRDTSKLLIDGGTYDNLRTQPFTEVFASLCGAWLGCCDHPKPGDWFDGQEAVLRLLRAAIAKAEP